MSAEHWRSRGFTEEQAALIVRHREQTSIAEAERIAGAVAIRACLDESECTAEPCGGELIVMRNRWRPPLPSAHPDADELAEVSPWQFKGWWNVTRICNRCDTGTHGPGRVMAVGSTYAPCTRRIHRTAVDAR